MDLRMLQADVVRNLAIRGLTPVPGRLAFVHRGQLVELALEPSVYSGTFVVVLEGRRKLRHFRARGGAYDWNAIAALVIETADNRGVDRRSSGNSVERQNERLARELASIVGGGPHSPLAIEPSRCAPGRVRVKLREVELDPISVMRLIDLVREAVPGAPARPVPGAPLA